MRRLHYLCVTLASASIFLIAAFLTPDARGFGTHEQLGLPPCPLHFLFGIHCPTCGLTTSFAHLMDGAWHAAFAAHMAGPFLAIGIALVGGFSIYKALRL